MVCYCCVKGCGNNSNIKKKDPSSTVSFHAFPSNLDLKVKWLRAIGRPNWDPPAHTRICSVHFSFDQISHDGIRTRILDSACPIKALPLNSNFEATHLEVCRICLACDVKMYSIVCGALKSCMETVLSLGDSVNIEGLPEYVCYECAAQLIKCHKLMEKSAVAQAVLLDLFVQSGQITKQMIKSQNRKHLNLKSSLKIHKTSPNVIYDFQYDNEINFSTPEHHLEIDDRNFPDDMKSTEIFKDIDPCKIENDFDDEFETTVMQDNDINGRDDGNDEGIQNDHDIFNDEDDKVFTSLLEDEERVKPENVNRFETTKRLKRKNLKGLTPDEFRMKEHFNIVQLTFEEQVEEWQKSINRIKADYKHKCEICSKMFAHVNTYKAHMAGHDKSRGDVECPVCKLRFKDKAWVTRHVKYRHGKKFCCNTCNKEFTTVSVAKKHHRWHAGHTYRCVHCAFSSAHASSLGAHVRARHAGVTCPGCGRACASRRGLALHAQHGDCQMNKKYSEDQPEYTCVECQLCFTSEGARRVHLLTSARHRKKPSLCEVTSSPDPAVENACRTCGEQFPSHSELVAHIRAEHPKKKKPSWSLPGDRYPAQCDHCSLTVHNRREHWSHVRTRHPGERGSYRPVITAVCDACGKGFQNKTKLHLHELRHGTPTVRCRLCPKLFYDKHSLSRHAAAHSDHRPHRCPTCDRAFKLRGNLERHFRVHTDLAPYTCPLCDKKFKYSTSLNLHVRCVHHKMPQPHRRRRVRTRRRRDDQ